MMLFTILIVLYVVIGLLISGFMCRKEYDEDYTIVVTGMVTALWPLLVGGLVLYLVAVVPYRLGEYIGNKIDEIESRK